jgi:hypothetical protein
MPPQQIRFQRLYEESEVLKGFSGPFFELATYTVTLWDGPEGSFMGTPEMYFDRLTSGKLLSAKEVANQVFLQALSSPGWDWKKKRLSRANFTTIYRVSKGSRSSDKASGYQHGQLFWWDRGERSRQNQFNQEVVDQMSIGEVRNWLGAFFLGTTAALGAYIILFQGTRALPIPSKDATSAFQIIIPTFIAQLTIAFRWIANPPSGPEVDMTLPRWAVMGPPIAVGLILAATLVLLIGDGGRSLDGGSIFKNSVTFCVSLLSASTAFIVSRVFGSGDHKRVPTPKDKK